MVAGGWLLVLGSWWLMGWRVLCAEWRRYLGLEIFPGAQGECALVREYHQAFLSPYPRNWPGVPLGELLRGRQTGPFGGRPPGPLAAGRIPGRTAGSLNRKNGSSFPLLVAMGDRRYTSRTFSRAQMDVMKP